MAINLNNFVNVSIQYHLSSQVSSTRDTVVLIVGGDANTDVTYSSLSEFAEKYNAGSKLYYYGYTYFTNGGVKLRVITHQTDKTTFIKYILTSDNEYQSFFTGETYYIEENKEATPKSLGLYKATQATVTSTGILYDIKDESYFLKSTPVSEGYFEASESNTGAFFLNGTQFQPLSAYVKNGFYAKADATHYNLAVTTPTAGTTLYQLTATAVEQGTAFVADTYWEKDVNNNYTRLATQPTSWPTNCYTVVEAEGSVTISAKLYNIAISEANSYAAPLASTTEQYSDSALREIGDFSNITVYNQIERNKKYSIDLNNITTDTTFSSVTGIYYCQYNLNIPTPLSMGLYIKETLIDREPVSYENLLADVQDLKMDHIVVATDANYKIVNSVAAVINSEANLEETMINMKIFVTCLEEGNRDLDLETKSAGVAVKYGVKGVEMTMAAYLCKANVDYYNSIQDYCFTTEEVVYTYTNSEKMTDTYGEYYEDDALYKALEKQNVNIDCILENGIRNLGGNDIKGNSLINIYVLILLNQTLTERLVGLLVNKIKYNQTGLTQIGATIAKELERYVRNGFLTTDKSWTKETLVYNGYTIINKNTPLSKGYKYVILPFATLSEADLKAHKLPMIYVLVADQYQIRKINVIGEVF